MNFFHKSAIQIISRVGVLVSGLFTTRWLISNLSYQEFFDYSQINDLLGAIVIIIITLSIPQLIYREYAKNNTDIEKAKLFWTAMFWLRVCSFFVGLILVVIFSYLFKINDLRLALFVFFAQYVLVFDTSFKSITDATARSYFYGITDLVSKLLVVFLLYLTSFLFPDLDNKEYVYTGILAFGYSLALGLDYYINRKYVGFAKFDIGIIKRNIKPIILFTFIGILSFIYTSSYSYFLGVYFDVPEAEYNAFMTTLFKIFYATSTLGLILLPPLAVHFYQAITQKDKKSLRKAILKYFLIMIGSYFLLTITILLIKPLIDSENKYPQILTYGFMLLPFIGVFLTSNLMYNLTTLFHKEKFDLYITIILTIFSIISQLFFIPIYGVNGAIISFGLVLVLDMGLKSILVYKTIRKDLTTNA